MVMLTLPYCMTAIEFSDESSQAALSVLTQLERFIVKRNIEMPLYQHYTNGIHYEQQEVLQLEILLR